MAISDRMRRIRRFRGLTSKEVGMGLGFSERYAESRMSQYESGQRVPKEKMIKELATAFDCNPEAIDIPDITSEHGAIFTLMELFQLYGFYPNVSDGVYSISWDKKSNPNGEEIAAFIKNWNDEYTKFKDGELSEKQFIEWMINYPLYSKNYLDQSKREKWLKEKD